MEDCVACVKNVGICDSSVKEKVKNVLIEFAAFRSTTVVSPQLIATIHTPQVSIIALMAAGHGRQMRVPSRWRLWTLPFHWAGSRLTLQWTPCCPSTLMLSLVLSAMWETLPYDKYAHIDVIDTYVQSNYYARMVLHRHIVDYVFIMHIRLHLGMYIPPMFLRKWISVIMVWLCFLSERPNLTCTFCLLVNVCMSYFVGKDCYFQMYLGKCWNTCSSLA